jgi:OCT family organic cation transporter-like MFS transporter 4/5
MVFVFFCWTILPESPRWLLTKKRVSEAKNILIKVAKTNKAEVPKDLEEKLHTLANAKSEASFGYFSLFASANMAMRTVFVTIAFTSSAFVYYQIFLNIGNMAGNMFLNLFLMGLVEGPGCVMGFVLGDRFGRRWTHCLMLLTNAILFFVLMWVVYLPGLNPLVIFLCMWIKMNISGTFVLAYMQVSGTGHSKCFKECSIFVASSQAMEVFPTCVRQSGIGFATLVSQMICIGGPYVIYLGATDLKLPYAIMFLVCLCGFAATVFLPETLGRTLPETIQEATDFGAKDKFFSFLPGREEKKQKDAEAAEQKKKKDERNPEEGKGLLYPSLQNKNLVEGD